MKNSITLTLFLMLFISSISIAQTEMDFRTNKGEKITIQTGKMAFADWAWFEAAGTPVLQKRHPRRSTYSVIGAPNYTSRKSVSQNVCSLGCGGSLILQFKDNALIDGPGQDLVIFEAGGVMEKTEVSISTDGKNWTKVGIVEGFTNALDISKVAQKGTKYHFVKLVDLYSLCTGKYYDGADIDAIAAIHSEQSIANQVSDRENEMPGAAAKNTLSIFPNPASYAVNLNFNLEKEDKVTFLIFDQMGKVVKTIEQNKYYGAGNHTFQVALDEFPASTYYILMKTSENSEMKKLIKQK